VPTKFAFVDGKDKYRINTLTRYLFKQNGFNTFFDEENLPEDLFQNRCLAFYADVVDISGGLATKVQIELSDCRGNLIFVSEEGKTKEKKYDKAYAIAIREAFESIKRLDYKYKPTLDGQSDSKTVLVNGSDEEVEKKLKNEQKVISEIERLQNEVNILKQEKEQVISRTEKGTTEVNKIPQTTAKMVIPENTDQANPVDFSKNNLLLFASPINNGFQVINDSKKEVMTLLYSGVPDTYIVKGQDALVFKKENIWMYSLNDDAGLSVKAINLKF
jgi:hypothetical protein